MASTERDHATDRRAPSAAERGVSDGSNGAAADDLPHCGLAAIMKRLLAQLVEDAGEHDLFTFFTHMVAQAAAKKTVVDLLAGSGVDIRLPDAVGHSRRQWACCWRPGPREPSPTPSNCPW
jgi:hypothetical protein